MVRHTGRAIRDSEHHRRQGEIHDPRRMARDSVPGENRGQRDFSGRGRIGKASCRPSPRFPSTLLLSRCLTRPGCELARP